MKHKENIPNVKKNVLWSLFSSFNLAVVLLILIVLLAVAGSLIPQQDAAREFARRIPPGWSAILQKMQVFDLYRSVWFFLLSGLFFLNLVICSLSRFPVTWKSFRVKAFPDVFTSLDGMSDLMTIMTEERRDSALQRLEGLLKKKYGRVEQKQTARGDFLFAEKGRFSHFGVYVIHLSILVIIGGAVAGAMFGFNAYVRVSEGEATDTVQLKGDGGIKKLDFTVRCERFNVDFYEDGAPREYRSELTFLKNGRVVHQGSLLVNHPVAFEGVRFYQSSYGAAPDGKISLSFRRGKGKIHRRSVGVGDVFELPEDHAQVRILSIEESMMQMGPAVKLNVRSRKGDNSFWVFKNIKVIEDMNPGIMEYVSIFNPGLFKPYVFSLDRVDRKYYTELQVAHDPGLPIVAFGAFLLVAGFMVVFFTSHRRIWISVEAHGDRTAISIAGRSNRDSRGLQREMERMMTMIKDTSVET
jgi:cytochrome c biogenesis protein